MLVFRYYDLPCKELIHKSNKIESYKFENYSMWGMGTVGSSESSQFEIECYVS
jgi:hypothetical protein